MSRKKREERREKEEKKMPFIVATYVWGWVEKLRIDHSSISIEIASWS